MGETKETYRQFCKTQEDLPIFYQPWYLDVVCCPDDWQVVLAQRGDRIAAAMPFLLKRKGPFKYITMPELCKFMGPYFAPDWRHSRHEHKLIKALIEQLPDFSFFNQNCHYDLEDWLPFYWKGFKQTTNYSYVLEPLDDLDQVLANFITDYRNTKLKKAKQTVSLSFDRSLEELFEVSKKSFDRQNLPFPLTFEFVKRYDQALEDHEARKMFFAVDQEEKIHSVVYLIWDKRAAYYLIAGDDPDLRSSGASIFLVWEAIKYSKEILGLNCFDFMGSMIPTIEKVRRNFGAEQKTYFNIRKYNSRIFQIMNFLLGR